MSDRAARRILWLALMLVAPLPMIGVFGAWVPVARYLLLSGVCVAMRLAEGPGGVIWQLFAMFVGHGLVYAALLWIPAWAVTRLLAPLPARVRTASVGLAVLGGLVWATATRPYVTPFGTAARANLFEVLR